ncbi:MAG: hypothetical protein WCC59_05220 [Terriglobales bacterium]
MLIVTAENVSPGDRRTHPDGTADYKVWVGINRQHQAMRFGVPDSESLRVIEMPSRESDPDDTIRLRTLCRVRVEGI